MRGHVVQWDDAEALTETGFVRAGSDAENMIEEEHAASRWDARFFFFVKFHFFFLGATTDQS